MSASENENIQTNEENYRRCIMGKDGEYICPERAVIEVEVIGTRRDSDYRITHTGQFCAVHGEQVEATARESGRSVRKAAI